MRGRDVSGRELRELELPEGEMETRRSDEKDDYVEINKDPGVVLL